MTPEQIIANKCRESGCSDQERKRHFQLFVHERWDVHPTDEFVDWWPKQPEAKACKTVTAWNTDRNRKQFSRWTKGEPEPESIELTEQQKEAGKRFLAQLRVRSYQRGGMKDLSQGAPL